MKDYTMIDVKLLNKLKPEEQLDIIKTMHVVAKTAYDKSEGESDEVRSILLEYLLHSKDLLEKARWRI